MLSADAKDKVRVGLPAQPGGIADQPPDAIDIEGLEGADLEDAVLDVAAKNEDSTSSRQKPQVIWVRSLVPKEKNSAAFAISCAVTAARGSSIIVPTWWGTRASLLPDVVGDLGDLALHEVEPVTEATSGIIISGRGRRPP